MGDMLSELWRPNLRFIFKFGCKPCTIYLISTHMPPTQLIDWLPLLSGAPRNYTRFWIDKHPNWATLLLKQKLRWVLLVTVDTFFYFSKSLLSSIQNYKSFLLLNAKFWTSKKYTLQSVLWLIFSASWNKFGAIYGP